MLAQYFPFLTVLSNIITCSPRFCTLKLTKAVAIGVLFAAS